MNPESELAVIIPTKNDEATIGSLVLLARQMVNNVIVVDDLSQDRTPEIARYAGAEVFSVDSYGGSGRIYSILVGCRRALESGCRAVVLIDGQSEPLVHDIYRVASPVLSGKADLVIGSREFFGRKTIPPYSPDGIVNRGEILDDEYIFTSTDPDSRFRALSIEAISLLDLLPNSDQFESTMITLFSNRGLRIREVPIALKYERPRRGKGFLPHYREHRVGVVVPAYNEEQLIGETISGIPDFVANVYVVNDCSEDRTGEIIDYYATQDPSIIPIHHDTNRGVGAAIVSGYRRALEDGMQIIAVMAGDNQMDPRFLPDLLDPIVNGRCDYTMGNRLINPEFRKSMSLWRFGGNVILTLLTKIAAGYWQMVDPQNGYTAISSRALAQIPLDNLYLTAIATTFSWLNIYGFRVINVPHPRGRLEKSKIRAEHILFVSQPASRILWEARHEIRHLEFPPTGLLLLHRLHLIGTLVVYSLYISIFTLSRSSLPASVPDPAGRGASRLLFALLFDMRQENKRMRFLMQQYSVTS